MAGGDDLLFRLPFKSYSRSTLEEIRHRFQDDTSASISFGVGQNVTSAYVNLRKAKAMGGGIVESDLP